MILNEANTEDHAMTEQLPILTGTAKQVSWASDIRDEAVLNWSHRIANFVRGWIEDGEDEGAVEARASELRAIVDQALETVDAEVWIDWKDNAVMIAAYAPRDNPMKTLPRGCEKDDALAILQGECEMSSPTV